MTLGADTLHDVVSLSTVTLSTVEVVDLVSSALNSADSLVDIIELAFRALSTEVVDQEVSWFADASVKDPVLVSSTDG